MKVMEDSFSKCVDRAKNLNQGSGAAVLRFFNLSSVSDVKSQQETMHLCFNVPRFFCTREFRRLGLRPMLFKMKTSVSAGVDDVGKEGMVMKSKLQRYAERHKLELPGNLNDPHPVFQMTMEDFVLRRGGGGALKDAWPVFLKLLSFYELGKLCNFTANTLRFKPAPDVLVLSPKPRIKTYGTEEAWITEVRMALIAYCNWGEGCASFASPDALDAMSEEDVVQLMEKFVRGGDPELARCPRFVKDAWAVGMKRREKKQRRKEKNEAAMAATVAKVRSASWKMFLANVIVIE